MGLPSSTSPPTHTPSLSLCVSVDCRLECMIGEFCVGVGSWAEGGVANGRLRALEEGEVEQTFTGRALPSPRSYFPPSTSLVPHRIAPRQIPPLGLLLLYWTPSRHLPCLPSP